jgi:hypothetical protein
MKNLNRASDGLYHVKGGAKYEKLIGSRAQVWHGTAYKTSGGLTKTKLFKNKNGRIVSKNKHIQSTKEKRLLKYGYGYKKKSFTLSKKKSRKLKGGSSEELITESHQPSNLTESSGFFSSLNNIMAKFTGGKSRKRRGGGVASNAAPVKGGRSRRIRGGMNGTSPNGLGGSDAGLWNSSTEGNDGHRGSPSLNIVATNYGGKSKKKKRSKRRKMRGGFYGQDVSGLSNAGSWNSSTEGNDGHSGSPSLNIKATNYGGKSKKKRSKRRKMKGGMYGQDASGLANAGPWDAKVNGNDGNNGVSLNLLATNY